MIVLEWFLFGCHWSTGSPFAVAPPNIGRLHPGSSCLKKVFLLLMLVLQISFDSHKGGKEILRRLRNRYGTCGVCWNVAGRLHVTLGLRGSLACALRQTRTGSRAPRSCDAALHWLYGLVRHWSLPGTA
ncbi:NAD(P)-binding Rossmann-fold superfamily protein [Striga asiatica]|uniref:NAD(P)-binding Rossmann-fold superfamily protein n=1 Tax=Striga asiatica TaxID=4170 RepID=A0A5A7P903_STRAF|nr:NAD(P)-binding Rossmann-fold superfamily protein [Striga asiatica]